MTRMLASVTGPEEAAVALAGGADIVDLKAPSRGALGAVPPEVVRQTVFTVAGRRPVSAVTGDLPMHPATLLKAATAMADAGAAFVKIGIFSGGELEPSIRALGALAGRTRLIAVLFADRSPDFAVLRLIADAGFAGAMLDTADKSGKRLLDHINMTRLRHFIEMCRKYRLLGGLAGSLEAPDVPRLLILSPDVLGFRGALCCERKRTAPISAEATRAIRELIPLEVVQDGNTPVDYRLLAARGYARDAINDPSQTDRVYLRDLILPVSIGAYAREREKPQKVRFVVEAAVTRGVRRSQDMSDVFSYDIISDGIRMLVDSGHVTLVETLAERIAALVLTHPRVVKVSVQVEKLDLGAGIAGVTIERTREGTVAALSDLFPGLAL